MDQLEEKHLTVTRGFDYRYYVSSAASADPSNPTIVLCHGWPDSAELWRSIVPHFIKAKLRVIVPDLFGAGGTSKPTDPKHFEIKAMVDDVMQILKAEDIDRNIIPMGHDWGSFLSQRMYLWHKDRMAGLVNLAVAFSPPSKEPFNLDGVNAYTTEALGWPMYEYWHFFADPQGPGLMEKHLESLFYSLHGSPDGWMKRIFCVPGAAREWVEKDRKDVELKPYAREAGFKEAWIRSKKPGDMVSQGCWYRAQCENIHLATEATLDGRVEHPYLYIGADNDPVCPTAMIELPKQMGLIKDLQQEELHGNHWTPLESPDEVARLTLQWLAEKALII